MKRGGFLKRRGPLRRRRLVARGTITNKMLDDACRAVVFARDGYRCRKTGETTHLQWAHIYSRRYMSIRWNPLNSVCLSAGAHLWWHHQPIEAAKWWLEQVGEGVNTVLRQALESPGKIDRRLTLLWLQQELKRYQRESPEGSGLRARTG